MKAFFASLLLVAACTPSASPSPSPSPPTTAAVELARPLRLPSVPAGAACPVTEPRPWSGHGSTETVLGDGPLYPVAYYFEPGTVLRLRADDREPDGSYAKKVRWIGAGYTGPVLVRAARIDGPGSASVEFSYTGQRRDGGHYAELTLPDSDLPAATTVSGPGCYAYQVDGTTFTITIVFRAA